MKKLRKPGGLLATVALAGAIALTGGAANAAASFIPTNVTGGEEDMPYIWNVGITPQGGYSDYSLRIIPIAYYTNITYETTNEREGIYTIVDAEFAPNTKSSVQSLILQTAQDAGWDVSSASEVIEKLTSGTETEKTSAATEFNTAVSETDWVNKNFGFKLEYDADKNAYLTTDDRFGESSAVAGLHLVISDSGEIEPYLMLTAVRGTYGIQDLTAYPEGLSKANPYPVLKNNHQIENAGELALRLGAVEELAESSTFADHGSALQGIELTITDVYGNEYSGTTNDQGIATFAAFDKDEMSSTNYQEFTITGITGVTGDVSSALIGTKLYTTGDEGYSEPDGYQNTYKITWKDQEFYSDAYGLWTILVDSSNVGSGELYFRVAKGNDGVTDISEVNWGDADKISPVGDVTITILRETDNQEFTATTDSSGVAVFANAYDTSSGMNGTKQTFRIVSITGIDLPQDITNAYLITSGKKYPDGGTSSTDLEKGTSLKLNWNGAEGTTAGTGAGFGQWTLIVADGISSTGLPVTGAVGIGIVVVLCVAALSAALVIRRKRYQEEPTA